MRPLPLVLAGVVAAQTAAAEPKLRIVAPREVKLQGTLAGTDLIDEFSAAVRKAGCTIVEGCRGGHCIGAPGPSVTHIVTLDVDFQPRSYVCTGTIQVQRAEATVPLLRENIGPGGGGVCFSAELLERSKASAASACLAAKDDLKASAVVPPAAVKEPAAPPVPTPVREQAAPSVSRSNGDVEGGRSTFRRWAPWAVVGTGVVLAASGGRLLLSDGNAEDRRLSPTGPAERLVHDNGARGWGLLAAGGVTALAGLVWWWLDVPKKTATVFLDGNGVGGRF